VTAHYTPDIRPAEQLGRGICEQKKCMNVVYADSLNPVSARGFLYTDPSAIRTAQTTASELCGLSALPCDILLTPHPEFSNMLDKLAKREPGAAANPFVDADSCRTYVHASRDKLTKRIAEETAK